MGMNTFGEKIKAVRVKRGLSVYEVEKQTDLDNSYLLRIEKGRQGAGDKVLKLLAPLYQIEYERLRVWKVISKLSEKEIEILKEELSS